MITVHVMLMRAFLLVVGWFGVSVGKVSGYHVKFVAGSPSAISGQGHGAGAGVPRRPARAQPVNFLIREAAHRRQPLSASGAYARSFPSSLPKVIRMC